MKKKRNKRHYGVKCTKCSDRIFSMYVYDFKYCKCGLTTIDGGTYYKHISFSKEYPPKDIYWTLKQDGVYPTIKYKDTFPY